jgi:F-type H+-transporting ATPase subunit c
MDAAAAKLIGAGIATFGMGLAALGVALIFGMFLAGALRNPAAADSQRPNLLLGFAVTEALGIFSFLVALILLFVV